MLERNKSTDIVVEIGGIVSADAAKEFLQQKMNATQYDRLMAIAHPDILLRVANTVSMCTPDDVFIITKDADDEAHIRQMALETQQEKKLAMPNHTIHFDLPEEQGRIVDRTLYVVNEDEDISSLSLKEERSSAMENIRKNMTGIMKGKTMMVGFYMRGPAGAPASNPALQISSSPYVLHSANLLYRNSYDTFLEEVERQGYFFCNIHSEGENRPEDLADARVYMDRSYQTTYAFKCTYAGNTLLMKKGNHRFAVDRSVYEKTGMEIAEHMFITGVAGPENRMTWIAGAAPSGCGKTTTAMAGTVFVGDDLAQMWIAKDGTVRAINPEAGIFGIVEDVNWEGDPILMKCLREEGAEVIWSNVLVDDEGVPHWVGNGEEPPAALGTNFQGHWEKGMEKNGKPVPVSHPNARCTLKCEALGNFAKETLNDASGVKVSVITYSGRDSDTMPPVWVAKTPDEGVAIGASIVSAATATEVGASGVKRAPWANSAFIPGTLADYMEAQFEFFNNQALAERPIMAGLNYFLTQGNRGGEGTKLLGEKRDVKVWLAWLERFSHQEVGVIEAPIGWIPKYADLQKLFDDILKKEYSKELYNQQFSLYIDNIIKRIDLQKEAYGKEEKPVPQRFFDVLAAHKSALEKLKSASGAIVTPDDLESV